MGKMPGATKSVWVHGGIGRVMAHAAAGCAGAMASGGSCGRGALTAGISEGGGNLGKYDGVVARAVLGGTVSVIGGGKFSNGAVMGAYSYIFNYCAHATGKCTTAFEQAMYDYWPGYKYGTCLSNGGCTASELAGTSADMAIGIVGGSEVQGAKVAVAAAGSAVRTEARNLAEQLILDEAKAGAGSRIMQGKIVDPRFPGDSWAKMQHAHTSPNGDNIVIHYWERLQDGMRTGFKFK